MSRILSLIVAALMAAVPFSTELRASARGPVSDVHWQQQDDPDTPAYHKDAPKGPLPKTLNPDMFDDPIAKNVYAMAAKIKAVLYQQPCYCHCDRSENHGSLLDCFVSNHGATCDMCQQEAIFAYNETKKGKSAVEIRKEIMDSKYAQVDLRQYKTVLDLGK